MSELVHECIDYGFNQLLDGNLKEAAECFEKSHRENPDNLHILLELSNIYYILGELSKSIK
ncbi:MAG TPA: tetratricopeptide repeat protein [Bacteroidales bacterium]|nr:tetratricopeptide repeat protein [Bacteroidales bacterium]